MAAFRADLFFCHVPNPATSRDGSPLPIMTVEIQTAPLPTFGTAFGLARPTLLSPGTDSCRVAPDIEQRGAFPPRLLIGKPRMGGDVNQRIEPTLGDR